MSGRWPRWLWFLADLLRPPRFDAPLLIAVVLLMIVGLLTLYSASGFEPAMVAKQGSRFLLGFALLWLLARHALQVARKVLERGAARVGVRVDALLQALLDRRQVGQGLLAAAGVLAQLALKVGQLLVELGALLGRQRLILRDLPAQLGGLLGYGLERLLHSLALAQGLLLRVGQHRQRYP